MKATIRRATGLPLASAGLLTVVGLTVGLHAYRHGEVRDLVGAVCLQVAAVCITWLALRRQPAKPEPIVAVWIDEVPNLSRDWVSPQPDPRAEALLAAARIRVYDRTDGFEDLGECADDEHFFPRPEEMGIDAEAVGWSYFRSGCGKEYDGRYDHTAADEPQDAPTVIVPRAEKQARDFDPDVLTADTHQHAGRAIDPSPDTEI